MTSDTRFADDTVALRGGRPRLGVRRPEPPGAAGGRPFLLVHGLASNARLWDGVAAALHAAGHDVLAVDLRGHGRSEAPDGGHDTATSADDLADLVEVLGLTGDRAPVAAGQSWGGNVVLSLAARHPGRVAAVACVDGGWIRLKDGFGSFDDCWAALAPPAFDGVTYAMVEAWIRKNHADWPETGLAGTLANLVELPDGGVRARLAREHHRSILRSLYEDDPRALYPRVDVPVLLVPAMGEEEGPADDDRRGRARRAVRTALEELPDATVRWYPGADHDLHAQFPDRLAGDLLDLRERVDNDLEPLQESPR